MDRLLEPDVRQRSRWRQAVGYAIAAALLGGVVWTLVREREALSGTWASIRGGAWHELVLLMLLPAMNWVFSTHQAWALLRPQPLMDPDERDSQPVLTRPEMYEVIGAAWLANLLPLRAGLVSRAVYHKVINRIPVGTTVRSVLVAVVLGLVASVLLMSLSLGLLWVKSPAWLGVLVLAVPYPVLLLAGAASPVADAGTRLTGGFGRWRLLDALAARYADTACWMARYWVAFRLVGHPITLGEAAVFASLSQLVMLVPLPGNAIGLREWMVGLVGPLMPVWLGAGDAELSRHVCLAADLTNRFAGVSMTLLVGTACSGLVAQRLRFRAYGPGGLVR